MPLAVPFSTITEMFERLTVKYDRSARPALMHKVDNEYRGISYVDLRRDVELVALGLASLGLKSHDTVAIVSENRPEWVVADLAAASLGAVDVPVYPTLTPKQLEFIFNDAGVEMAVVSNTFQLNKVLKIKHSVRTLKHILLMSERGLIDDRSVVGWSRLRELGRRYGKDHPHLFTSSLRRVRPDDLLTIIYTSGTTGNPKGVMLTHRNLVSNIQAITELLPISDADTLLSFLPLCHSFERMGGYYTALACGATIAFAESIETVRDNLLEIRPTLMTTVPRLFERIYARILRQVEAGPATQRKIFHWAVRVGKRYARGRRRGSVDASLRLQHALASRLVFSRLQKRTGGRIRFFASGGAALSRDLGEFFEAIGITILEGYGLTETSPVLTVNRLDDYKFGTVVKPIPGVEIKIAEDGEILAKGPNIMKGYFNNQAATAEVIDREGWFHTGDIGMFDPEGHLVITDRKKHLFISSGGKNIAPQPIESLFLQSKYIDQFVLIGDGRMYCTALVVPEFDMVKEFAQRRGLPLTDGKGFAEHEEIRKLFTQEIDRIQKDLPNFERVRRFELLSEPLTVENGEITPTLKVKRKIVEQKYSHLIDKMYRER